MVNQVRSLQVNLKFEIFPYVIFPGLILGVPLFKIPHTYYLKWVLNENFSRFYDQIFNCKRVMIKRVRQIHHVNRRFLCSRSNKKLISFRNPPPVRIKNALSKYCCIISSSSLTTSSGREVGSWQRTPRTDSYRRVFKPDNTRVGLLSPNSENRFLWVNISSAVKPGL